MHLLCFIKLLKNIIMKEEKQIVSDEDMKLLELFSLLGKRAEQKSPAIAACFGNNDAQGSLYAIRLALDSLVQLGCDFNEDDFVEMAKTLQQSNLDGAETILRVLYSATRHLNELEAYRNLITDLLDLEYKARRNNASQSSNN